jgi:uncharacterized protein (DUF427 family)
MAIQFGTGPLAGGGEPHVLDEPRRLRAVLGDRVVLDSTRAKLVFAPSSFMTPCVPREDVAGGVAVEDAVVAGHVTLAEEGAQWFLEEERVFGHLRDPYHRVDVVEASRPAAVTVAGTTVASTPRAKLLYETSLPLRGYFPATAVEAGVLTPSDKRTQWPLQGGGQLLARDARRPAPRGCRVELRDRAARVHRRAPPRVLLGRGHRNAPRGARAALHALSTSGWVDQCTSW